MEGNRLRHMVVFSLHHGPDAAETETFLADGQRLLSAIPTVEHFEVLRQISPKCDYDYGFSMEFADRAAYEAYNADPDHVAFVEERWKKEVARFQEIDFSDIRVTG
ncbi:Dabb family protein [Paenibacillus sambharensis]|uniref:Dabb family protein n=1 Tax=Paenibacillus sambharensis TaxID=1803190 RepID=A0A2W1M147_9BACL|nr:Dabb family protein [Paenibacillus sambharensis]PZD97651.1 Dabb family protein [Paenibacillus sambharensis]